MPTNPGPAARVDRRPRESSVKRLFSESEPKADFARGVPGVQWHGKDGPPPSAPQGPPPLVGTRMPITESSESFTLYVGIVAAVALFLRLAVLGMGPATDVDAAYTPDTAIELQLARGLADGLAFGLTEYPEDSRFATVEAAREARGERSPLPGTELYPDAYFAPGYPAVLAAFVKTGLDLRWLLLLQCGLAVGTTLVAYRVGLMLMGRQAPALLISALTALHPALIVAPAALSGGVIAVALLMLGLWAVSAREDTEPLIASAGGLSLGVSSLFNPLLVWAAPLIAVWLMLSGRRTQSLVVTGAMLLGAAAPPGLWMYRNARVGLGATLTRAPDVERYMGVLGSLEAPSTERSVRDAAMLRRLPAAKPTANQPPRRPGSRPDPKAAQPQATDLFQELENEARWRLREQGNAYLQLGNERALRTLVRHSAPAAFTRLKLDYTPQGGTAAWLGETNDSASRDTPGTASLAATWVMLNFLLLAATVAGTVALLWRRHVHEAGLLLILGVVMVVGCVTLPGEAERLPVFAIQIMLIGGILSPEPLRMARAKKPKRADALRLERIAAAPGPGGPLAPLGTAGGLAAPAPIAAPPSGAGSGSGAMATGQQSIHPMLRSGTSEMDSPPPPPGRLI